MADFWAGVAQGFGPAYQRSTDRRQLIEDRKLARKQSLEDAEKAAIDKIIDEYIRLGGENTSAIDRRDKHALLREIGVLEREVQDKVHRRTQQEKREGMRATLGKASRPVQAEALQSVGGVPVQGLARGVDARTLTPTHEEFKGMDRGALAGASVRAEAQQAIANDLAAEKRKEDRDKAAEERKRAHDLRMKRTLGAQPPATPKLSEQDMRNEILEWEGQLGITTGTKPSEGLQMRSGPQLRQYHGELKRKIGDMEALRPKYQAPKDEDKGTQAERASTRMNALRTEYNSPETTPERRSAIASEALGILPLLYGGATQTHTIKDAEGFLQGKGLPPKITATARTKEPDSPEALSKEETDHLNAARTMQRAKNLFMAQFGEKDAKKQLTIEGQLNHWVRNVAGAAAGLESWKDEEAAKFRAAADNLTAKALAQTHQMMGGGAFSEPDRILYERTIPTTKTFSPVNYMAKLKAWSEGLDDYVDYMSARQKIAGLPRLVSDMEPWQVMKFTGKKDDDGNVIISKGMAEMLIEHKLALNPETNKTWTTQGLLDYQRENEQHGFTKQDMINFILMLPYEVKPPR
jgi:hypothetical protein